MLLAMTPLNVVIWLTSTRKDTPTNQRRSLKADLVCQLGEIDTCRLTAYMILT